MAEVSIEQLARFQSALIEALARETSLDTLRSRLQSEAAFLPFRDYLQACDPRMLQVAADLIKKWGRRHAAADPPAAPAPSSASKPP